MMKKIYIQPQLEILPYRTQIALCSGGEVSEGLEGGDNGKNPWEYSRSPHRTPVF